jgi:hypothetical protein
VAGPKKLAIMAPPPHRERPVTNLGKVFGQFADLQQQIAEQVIALEDSVYQQRQDLALAMAQMPDVRERINWLIASFYEQSKKDESVREKLNRHDAALATLTEAVRSLHQAQSQWQSAIEDILSNLARAKAVPLPPLPEL